jgi:hypothetical protein
MSDLLLRQVLESRAGAEERDDYDVIDGAGQHEDRLPTHGYEPTCEAAMEALARSWNRES